jgi:hypothetical protein
MASLYTLSLKSDPSNVRYVGITKYDEVLIRLKAHKEKAGKVNRPVCDWIFKHYDEVLITKVSGNLTWEEACIKEKNMIKNLKDLGFNLLNMTDGGDGSIGRKESEDTKKKKSEALKGHKVSKKTREKISKANKGKKRSNEAKIKMANAKKGKTLSPEHVEKIRKKLIGRPCTTETAKKISEAQKGKKISDTHLNNLIAAQKKRREREKRQKEENND